LRIEIYNIFVISLQCVQQMKIVQKI